MENVIKIEQITYPKEQGDDKKVIWDKTWKGTGIPYFDQEIKSSIMSSTEVSAKIFR